jgi:hypothetical protein
MTAAPSTVDESKREHLAKIARLGAVASHLGTTVEERRERTAAARAALAAKRKPRKPTLAEKIAAVEATLPGLDLDERVRQEAWIAAAKELSAGLAEAS